MPLLVEGLKFSSAVRREVGTYNPPQDPRFRDCTEGLAEPCIKQDASA